MSLVLRHISRSQIFSRPNLVRLLSLSRSLNVPEFPKKIETCGLDSQQNKQFNISLVNSQRSLKTGPPIMRSPYATYAKEGDVESAEDLVHAAAIAKKKDKKKDKKKGDKKKKDKKGGKKDKKGKGKGKGRGKGKKCDGKGPCGGCTTLPSDDMLLDVPIEIDLKLNVRLEEYTISPGDPKC